EREVDTAGARKSVHLLECEDCRVRVVVEAAVDSTERVVHRGETLLERADAESDRAELEVRLDDGRLGAGLCGDIAGGGNCRDLDAVRARLARRERDAQRGRATQ